MILLFFRIVYLFMLRWVFPVARAFLSLWPGGYSLVVVLGLLAVVPLGGQGRRGTWASVAAGCGLNTRSGQDLEHRLHHRGVWVACGHLPGSGIDRKHPVPCLIGRWILHHWTTRQGSPFTAF